jgi:hypothetical protein
MRIRSRIPQTCRLFQVTRYVNSHDVVLRITDSDLARRYPPFENSYQERARKSDDTKVTLEEFEDENSPQNLSAWHQTIPAQFSNFCGVPSVSGPSKKVSVLCDAFSRPPSNGRLTIRTVPS